ncbi:MAG TPA: hypothetical protein VGM93_07860, partial [Acidimicrobiales bacterium]
LVGTDDREGALGWVEQQGDGGRQRMGQAGQERVDRLFRLDRQIDAWERFYQEAFARRHAR